MATNAARSERPGRTPRLEVKSLFIVSAPLPASAALVVLAALHRTPSWIAALAAGGAVLVSLVILWLDRSERRVAATRLRLLARQVVHCREEERAHLARELHDGTSQTLVSAKLHVESAVDQLERDRVEAPASLMDALARLDESLVEVRRIAHRLRPAVLDTLNLPLALELLASGFGKHLPGRVACRIEGIEFELPEEVKTSLFRVAQEGLANAARHARAGEVRIDLRYHPQAVLLDITDDGIGFDVAAVELDPRRGIGLRNMRERLAAIDGVFQAISQPGQGTRLEACVTAEAIGRLEIRSG